MDPRAHRAFDVPAISIPSGRLIEFFADSAALEAFLETLEIANSNSPNAALAERQKAVQLAILAAQPVKTVPTREDLAVQYQPVRPFVTFTMMAQPQHGGVSITFTPEQRAANEELRQRQYDAQVAMLAAKATPTP